MDTKQLTEKFKLAGEEWLKGAEVREWSYGNKHYKFFPKQIQFINSKKYLLCGSGGYGAGKTLAGCVRVMMMTLFFPNNEILIGRRFISDVEKTILPILTSLVNPNWYRHKVKAGELEFFNGSKIILFGLDSLQAGSESEIRKSRAKMRGLSLGSFFIDQTEDIEYEVFHDLLARLRRIETPFRSAWVSNNPHSFWGLQFFKENKQKRDDILLVEFSMLDNSYLPESYIKDQMNNPESYIRRYVKGEWSKDLLTPDVIIAKEYIERLEKMVRSPDEVIEGFKIWHGLKPSPMGHFIGVDSSEGVKDASSISVISANGEKVASFNGRIPVPALIEKVKFIYNYYFDKGRKPLVVPEITGSSGFALLQGIKDLNLYEREVWDEKRKKKTKKLGFKTSWKSKNLIIQHFIDLLRQNAVIIYDKNTIEEFKTFVYSDEAKKQGAGAVSSAYSDDDVISTLLGFLEVKTPQLSLEEIRKMRVRRQRTAESRVHQAGRARWYL